MIRITATIICCLIARILAAQNPTYAWSASMGADSSDYGIALATDAFDNVYTTGCCTGTVDFDPGPGTYTLGSAAGPAYSGTRDIFVSKMDASGNILWAKRMGDTTFHFATFGNHISVDAGGNIITTGLFTGTVDFDPGAGVFNLSSPTNNGWRIFILKLDASGNFVWAKMIGGNYSGQTLSAVLDPFGNILAAGRFQGTIDMDPGPGTVNFTSPNSIENAFILKLDAMGNFVFAKQWSATGINSFGVIAWGVCLDATGNIYTAGGFSGTGDFDPGPGTYSLTAPQQSHFILKLDAAGNFVWAGKFGSGDPWGNYGLIAAGNDLYVTGTFMGTADFDPGPGTFSLTVTGTPLLAFPHNQFILKLDLAGNFVWAKSIVSTEASNGVNIDLDVAGSLYAIGTFEGTADLDPGPGVYTLTSNGFSDAFILKLDAAGNLAWAEAIGGSGEEWPAQVSIGMNADIYLTGSFQSTFNVDPGNGFANIISTGREDIFVLKWAQCSWGLAPVDNTPPQNKFICQNTAASLFAYATNPISWYGSLTGSVSLGTGTNFMSPPLALGVYTYYAADPICNGVGRTAISVMVDVCTGLTSMEQNEITWTVYPVPSADGLITAMVNSPNSNLEIMVFNILGQEILKQKVSVGLNHLDLSGQPTGLYVIKLVGDDKALGVQKIIRQ